MDSTGDKTVKQWVKESLQSFQTSNRCISHQDSRQLPKNLLRKVLTSCLCLRVFRVPNLSCLGKSR